MTTPAHTPKPTRARQLPRSFFARPTLQVARDLLGQRLVRLLPDGVRLAGLITETEAYVGSEDLGCHARSGRTARNEAMWGPPGHAYVYFTYGMHWMLNFVTEAQDFPAAVLLRGMWPTEGLEIMTQNRSGKPPNLLSDGPAKLCQALQIDRDFNHYDICHAEAQLLVEQRPAVNDSGVTTGPRVGLTNVPEPWKSMPWRFRVDPLELDPSGGGKQP